MFPEAASQSPYPQMAYWKPGPDLLEGNSHIDLVRRFFEVSGMNLLVILMDMHERGYNIPASYDRLREITAEAHRLGGRIACGVDIRYLTARLAEKYPEDNYGVIEPVTATVMADGTCTVNYKLGLHNKQPVEYGILKAWILRQTDASHYEPDSLQLVENTAIESGSQDGWIALKLQTSPANAGLTALFIPYMQFSRLDLFSENLLDEYASLIDRFDGIGLDGMITDEFGLHIPNDADGLLRKFHYSEPLARAFQLHTGRSFDALLPALRFAPAGKDHERLSILNSYFELIRLRCVEIEQFLYNEVKRRCGPDGFTGLHPTFWNECALEVFHDGLDWWSVPRDYAQTDEQICTPIRLALSRKCGPVWYNMWYTNGELNLESYCRETLRYARFGGRTHYHSYYSHSEKQLVGTIGEPGVLEKIAEMERWIYELNRFQKSQPDARVAVVAGTAALTNWAIEAPECHAIPPDRGCFLNACAFANRLLECGWLCDLLPDYEIENGSMTINGEGKPVYGTQTYDALVFLYPDYIKPAVFDFMKRVAAGPTVLVIGGSCSRFFDGSAVGNAFEAVTKCSVWSSDRVPSAELVAGILRRHKIAGNVYRSGCRYQDGSAVFVASGEQPCGNPLRISEYIDGHHVEADADDFLGIKLRNDGSVERLTAGRLHKLIINGKASGVRF